MRREYVQHGFDLRLEWGREGAASLAEHCAVVVIVEVLGFGLTVDMAVARGAAALPLAARGNEATAAAHHAGAVLPPNDQPWSASALAEVPAGTLLALPGSDEAWLLALAARGGAHVLVGCLRNTAAVARTAQHRASGGPIGLVPAGKRWDDGNGAVRPAVEDAVGAGAVAAVLPGAPSPEAEMAAQGFLAARRRGLRGVLAASASARALAADGHAEQVRLAGAVDASEAAPRLADGVLRG